MKVTYVALLFLLACSGLAYSAHASQQVWMSIDSEQTVYAGVMDLWHQDMTVSFNITVKNQSPHSTGLLYYRVVNMENGGVVVDWNVGDRVVLKMNGETQLSVVVMVPVSRSLEADVYTVETKLVLVDTTLQSETVLTIQKDGVQRFFGNAVVGGLCVVLVGVAVFSYRQKEKPWKKYPMPKTT